MRQTLATGLALILILLLGISCGPKDIPQPPPRPKQTRPKSPRATLPVTDVQYRVGDECSGGHEIELVRYHRTRGPISEKKIGCGRVNLPGGKMMNGPLQHEVAAFTMLVTRFLKKDKPADDDDGSGASNPNPTESSDELESEKQPTYAYAFWGPAGKQFHKAGNMPKILDMKIVGQRWLTYQFALEGAPLRGFTIADSKTDKTIDDSGSLASKLVFREQQVLFVLMEDGKAKLYCAELTTMRAAELATLPELDGSWEESVKWTAAGKIRVSGKRRDNDQPFTKILTCGPAKKR